MRPLYLRTLRILGVRLVRGAGYRGRGAGAVALVAAAVVLTLDLLAASWIETAMPASAGPGSQFGGLLAASILVALFFLAGPALLLTESIRDRGSRIQAVLTTLPLTLREISLITWLPGLVAALALVTLLFVPGVAAFKGLDQSWSVAGLNAGAAVLSGICLSALVIAGGRVALRGHKWSGVQYPVMLSIWFAVCATESWQAGVAIQARHTPLAAYVLVVPWLARDVSQSGAVTPLALAVVAVAAVGSLLLLASSARTSSAPRLRTVRWRWRRGWPLPLAMAELTRLLRSGAVITNAVGAAVFATGITALLGRLPSELREGFAPVLLAVAMSVNAAPLVLVRGQTRARWPTPLLLGIGPRRWAGAQIAASAAVFTLMAVPPAVVLLLLGMPATIILTAAVPYGVLAFGMAMAVGWLMPASPDNPLGQVVDSLVTLFLISAVAIALGRWLPTGSAPWAIVTVVVGLAGLLAVIVIERGRWVGQLARPPRPQPELRG